MLADGEEQGNVGTGDEASNDAVLGKLLATMLNENQRRDQMLERMFANLQTAAQPVVTCQVVPGATDVLPDFDGTGDPSEWLASVRCARQMHQWLDAVALDVVRTHLRGGPSEWWKEKGGNVRTFNEFEIAFRRTFVVVESMPDKWKRMESLKQERDQDVGAYFHAKSRLCSELRLTEDEKKEQIIIGLYDQNLCNTLMAKQHRDCDELYHDIVSFLRINKARSECRTPMSKPKEPPAWDNRKLTLHKSSPTESSAEPKCFNCNKYGHLSYDCPAPKRELVCLRCKETGHTQKHCTRSVMTVRTTTEYDSIRKYIKTVTCNAVAYTALIDPGSSECTIKASLAISGPHRITRVDCKLKGFGTPTNVITSPGVIVADLEIEDVKVQNVEVRIVPDDAQSVDMIIGRPFTDHPEIMYFRIDGELHFKYREENPFQDVSVASTQIRHQTVSKAATIMRNSVNFIDTIGSKRCTLAVATCNGDELVLPVGRKLFSGEICELTAIESKDLIVSSEIQTEMDTPSVIREKLLMILNEYRDCVAKNVNEIGCTSLMEMRIDEMPDSKPVQCKPYKASFKEREQLKEIIAEYKSAGIVTETNSPYASPVVLVKKKNGTARMVVDYRRLNAQTVTVPFPLPDIDDHLMLLSNAKVFTVLDLANGYLQVPLSDESRKKTAFITPDETGEFTKMIFGLKNGPFQFSKLMKRVLGPLYNDVVLHYLDDIMLPACDWEEMKSKLCKVLAALREARLTLRLEKCYFMMKEVDYLGYRISERGIEPGIQKSQAIINFPTPKDHHQVRRFLGMASFFRKFICNFGSIAKPMYDLLKKNVTFRWSSEQDHAFHSLKMALSSKPVLKPFDAKLETELHTDASSIGVGAMLMQKQESKWYLVYAASRRTSESEQNYHSSKLELMAIIWAVHKLRKMLINIHFTIVTDCEALTYLRAAKTKNSQIARWYNLLSEYSFDVKHKPGVKLAHVDALSRAPIENVTPSGEESVEKYVHVFTIFDGEDEVVMYQQSDTALKRKLMLMNKQQRTSQENAEIEQYVLRNGILYKCVIMNGKEKLLYVAPNSMRKNLLVRYHDLQGHFGVERTMRRIMDNYYFPGMRQYVKQHIHMCITCIVNKSKSGKQAGLLNPIPAGKRPFEIVHVDHLGPFISSSKNNKYVLVFIDNLTKFVKLRAVRDTSAACTVKHLEEIVYEVGAPRRIISDRGTCYISKKFEELCAKHGIQHTLNSPRHPQANGQVERVNRTLLPLLRKHEDQVKWDKEIKKIEQMLNTSINKTTNETPFKLLYGYDPCTEEGAARALLVENECEDPFHLQEVARAKISEEQSKYKQRFDKKRYHVTFNVGDIVYMKVNPTPTGDSTKLQQKYRGPLTVTRVLPSNTYLVCDIRDSDTRRYATTAHVSQLKLWRNFNEEEEELAKTEEVDDWKGEPSVTEEFDEGNGSTEQEGLSDENRTGLTNEEPEDAVRRPSSRRRMRPVHLDDYVC